MTRTEQTPKTETWQAEDFQPVDPVAALRAIAEMSVTPDTDHAQLSALCIAIARNALSR